MTAAITFVADTTISGTGHFPEESMRSTGKDRLTADGYAGMLQRELFAREDRAMAARAAEQAARDAARASGPSFAEKFEAFKRARRGGR